MSSQPIIIQVVDQIDPTIVAKINGISTAARTAAKDVVDLQAALASITGTSALTNLSANLAKIQSQSLASASSAIILSKSLAALPTSAVPATTSVVALAKGLGSLPTAINNPTIALLNLSQGLGKIPVPAQSVWQWFQNLGGGSSTLANRLANLVARVTGAELGIGRLGGAIGGLLTALGPVGLAIIGVVAILGTAFFLTEKWRKEEEALIATQTAIGKQFGSMNDRLLEQKETLTGLTAGPLAKYAQELKDLPLKSIDIDFNNLTKELDEQHSYWQKLNAEIERWEALVLKADSFGLIDPAGTQKFPDIRDTKRFLEEQQRNLAQGKVTVVPSKSDLDEMVKDAQTAEDQITKNRKAALESQMAAIRNQINIENRLRADQVGAQARITDVNLAALHEAYNMDLLAYREYLNKKKIAGAEYNRQAAEDQARLFQEEMDRLKASVPGGIVTAQDELRLRQQQLSGAPRPTAIPGLDSRAALSGPDGGNIRKLNDDIVKLTAEINRQGFEVDNLVHRYQNAIEKQGAYSKELQAQAEYERLVTDVQAKRIPLTDELSKRLREVAEQGVEDSRVNREKIAIYNAFKGPIDQYDDALKATTALVKENAITEQEAAIAIAKAARAKQDALDPLNEYKIGLQHEVELLGTYGRAATVAAEVDRVRQSLQAQGRDLDQSSIDTLTKFLTLLEQEKNIQQEETRLWEQNAGAKQRILERQLALNKAYFDGVITLAQYKDAALDAALAQNKLNNQITGGTLKSNVVQIYGELIDKMKGAHPVINALEQSFSQFFKSLKKGFADSIAQVLVFGGSMKEALLNTARNAVAALISELIQLGIEFLIVTALAKVFGISLPKKDDSGAAALKSVLTAVASIAVITAAQFAAINLLMGPAWALAEAVSLFSFGANAAPAEAGIAAVIAQGTAASTAGKFEHGGFIPGVSQTPDDTIIKVTRGEFVVNREATSKNRDLLEAINRQDDVTKLRSITTARFADGGLIAGFAAGGIVGSSSYDYSTVTNVAEAPKVANNLKVNVVHDGSTNIDVQQIDEETIRIIARREARGAVQEHAPAVVARAIYDPNSTVSKAVSQNTDSRRRR